MKNSLLFKLSSRTLLLLLFAAMSFKSFGAPKQMYYEIRIYTISGSDQESRVDAFLRDAYIPALHLTDQVKWTFKTGTAGKIKNPYIQLELESHFNQKRIDIFETATSGYLLLNFSAGTNLKVQKQIWTLYISAANLLDTKYYDHLSRLKEVEIYNMGRRVTFGLVIPFGIYQNEKD